MNNKINELKDNSLKLLDSEEFNSLAVIYLSIALEKQLRQVIIFNYRKSGLSAKFIRDRLLKLASFSHLLQEFTWSNSKDLKIKELWKNERLSIKDLNGLLSVRNKIMHSVTSVSKDQIHNNVSDLIYVIERFAVIFDKEFGFSGLEQLPKNISKDKLLLSNKILNRNVLSSK
jgi:hypothetical protein